MFEYRTCELQDNQEQVVSLVPVSRQEEWEDDSSSSPLLKVAVPLDPALPQVNAVQVLPPLLSSHIRLPSFCQ